MKNVAIVAALVVVAISTASAEPTQKQPRPAPTKRTPATKLACDADNLQKRGDDQLAKRNTFGAAAEYQRALECDPTERRYLRAGIALCLASRCRPIPPQVKLYATKLSPSNREKLVQACTSYDCGWPPFDDAP